MNSIEAFNDIEKEYGSFENYKARFQSSGKIANGDMLIWARVQAGLTKDDAVLILSKSNIPLTINLLECYERGTISTPKMIIHELASIYNQPMDIFYCNILPKFVKH